MANAADSAIEMTSKAHELFGDLLRNRFVALAIAVALVLAIATTASACPTCREGLAQNDPQGQSIAAGYYYSILFMMSMPFIILGTFGSFAYRSVKRAEKNRLAANKGDLRSDVTGR
jgi:hypothetical protein